MEKEKDKKYYLEKINEDIEFVIQSTKNITYEDFINNKILCDSVCFRFIQMSENAKRIQKISEGSENSFPFTLLIGLRNRIVHDYGSVDLHTIYQTVINDLPELKKMLGNS